MKMNAVDGSDHILSAFSTQWKCVRWWKTLFFHLIDIAVVNSFILFQAHRAEHTEIERPAGYSQCDFFDEIVREICGFEEYGDPPTYNPGRQRAQPSEFETVHVPHFSEQKKNCEPPSHTLVRLAELVLTLNSFSFNGDYFQQTGGVAMGGRLGPNYACLFIGHVEEKIFQQYPEKKPDLYKRYIDDITGAASCNKNELDNFAESINIHPSLKFTWAISDNQFPFLDLLLTPTPKD